MQKAERLIQKAESTRLTPAQAARVRELESRPGAGQARAQGEKALAAHRQAAASKTTKVDMGPGLRTSQTRETGLSGKPAAVAAGGSYRPGASPLGGGLPSGGGSGSGLGAPAAWAKGR